MQRIVLVAQCSGGKPFFEGLWAVMRLQVLPESLGGAGSRRIEWEFDDGVFMESAYVKFPQSYLLVFSVNISCEKRERVYVGGY